MEAKDFLEIATELTCKKSNYPEAAYRSAVNRAYYACYLKANKIVWDLYHEDIRHQPMLRCFKYAINEEIRAKKGAFAKLQVWRTLADYKMNKNIFTAKFARECVDVARVFLQNIEDLRKRNAFSGMEEYIQLVQKGKTEDLMENLRQASQPNT